jgi:CBS domain-containing protein
MGNTLLAPHRVRAATDLPEQPSGGDYSALTPDDSAYCALTDFNREYPITEPAGCTVDEALNDMERIGVHALVVTKAQPEGADQQVVGLITSADIQHLRFQPGKGKVRIEDVMTSWDELPLVKYESLQDLTALELYQMFQGTGLSHLLVVEDHGSEAALARGLISRASLAMRLSRTAASLRPL